MNFDLSLNILDEEVWCLDELEIFGAEAPTGTNLQLNISDSWKTVTALQINIGDSWKSVTGAQVNIGDSWETVF
jgi:hypothetical protein